MNVRPEMARFLFTERSARVLAHVPEFARLYARLFTDSRVSLAPKALLVGAALYLISPLDFVPGFVPILGQIDDIAVVLGSLWLFVRLSPPDVVREHVRSVAVGRKA